jgi:excisionase family DNA binding protein
MLDMSISQVYNLINRGELGSIRIGRSVRVPESALRKLANSGEHRERPSERTGRATASVTRLSSNS